MILLLDNYDSFTYNLYQAIGPLCPDVQVVRNDKITIDEMEKMGLQALIVSPGPGYPSSAGISEEAIRHFSGKIPILGICLGHQAIGEAFGGRVVPAIQLMHGKASSVTLLKRDPIFAGLPETVEVARYHSLIVQRESLPDTLEMLAEDEVGQIMAVKHKEHLTYGLQFHPESILTGCGGRMLENFLNLVPNLSVTPLNTPQSEIPPAQRNALKPYIFKAIEGENLTREEAFDAMTCIMNGGATNAQIGSFLTALRMKGETTEEITGFTQVMRKKDVYKRQVMTWDSEYDTFISNKEGVKKPYTAYVKIAFDVPEDRNFLVYIDEVKIEGVFAETSDSGICLSDGIAPYNVAFQKPYTFTPAEPANNYPDDGVKMTDGYIARCV